MKRVLVVVTRQIGDVLLTTPLVRQARVLWPQAQVDVLGFAGTLGMLAGNPDVHETIAMPAKSGWRETLAFARRLWRRYDLALIADPGDRAHLVGFVAARQRAGLVPVSGSSNRWKRRWLAHAVTAGGDLSDEHVVTEKLRLLMPWQGPGASPTPEPAPMAQPSIAPPWPAARSAATVVGPAGAPLPAALEARLSPAYVVVHTPSMWPYKQWPLPHFRALIARLAQAGKQVVLTGSASEGDRAAVAAMQGTAPDAQLVDAGVLTFNQLATLIRGAALYIGPDTSVSHLAAACEVPVLAIFGPTNPRRWAPWPGVAQPFERVSATQTIGHVTIVQADTLPCVPCGRAGCEDHRGSRSDCLQAITPERVAAQALRLLAG